MKRKTTMPELKLARLPDRKPVKITITVSPELNLALRQYAGIYRATYGEAESVAVLIPFMLGNFLEADKGFAKARKEGMLDTVSLLPDRPARAGRRAPATPSPITSTEA
jgi:hypothetical protein